MPLGGGHEAHSRRHQMPGEENFNSHLADLAKAGETVPCHENGEHVVLPKHMHVSGEVNNVTKEWTLNSLSLFSKEIVLF